MMMRTAAPWLAALAATARAEPDLQGMWSDPPETIADTACMFACTDVFAERFATLLDEPANDGRPAFELLLEAQAHERAAYLMPRLTDAARATVNLDPPDEPEVLCRVTGLAVGPELTAMDVQVAASTVARLHLRCAFVQLRRQQSRRRR